ncbi:copper transporter 1-like [Diospyros lotus]|uniref:copper transporter 1-like n=1 Tax=Diospyros lotus TaxID=55363 RepID=UPI002253B828|nr:copper transporter 1-like [Diospyros lotus]
MAAAQKTVTQAPPVQAWFNATCGGQRHRRVAALLHMRLYWGKHAEVLFPGWPGNNAAMYALALVFVFVLSLLVEWLSHSDWFKPQPHRVSKNLLLTAVHAVRFGLVYMVILAVMSHNGGVFLAAVLGHAVGYSFTGGRRLLNGRR